MPHSLLLILVDVPILHAVPNDGKKLCKIMKQEWKSEGESNKYIESLSQNTYERT
jgi:hypothetical protein